MFINNPPEERAHHLSVNAITQRVIIIIRENNKEEEEGYHEKRQQPKEQQRKKVGSDHDGCLITMQNRHSVGVPSDWTSTAMSKAYE